jgi:hypothetical protein
MPPFDTKMLVINSVHAETGAPMDPSVGIELRDAIGDLSKFVGAARVEHSRGFRALGTGKSVYAGPFARNRASAGSIRITGANSSILELDSALEKLGQLESDANRPPYDNNGTDFDSAGPFAL